SSLVVQAGSMGGRGQVYVLDMGKPVKIIDLARQMIELSGRTEEQVGIAFVGTTSHPKIMRAARPPIDGAWLEDELSDLERLVAEADTLGVVSKLGAMIR